MPTGITLKGNPYSYKTPREDLKKDLAEARRIQNSDSGIFFIERMKDKYLTKQRFIDNQAAKKEDAVDNQENRIYRRTQDYKNKAADNADQIALAADRKTKRIADLVKAKQNQDRLNVIKQMHADNPFIRKAPRILSRAAITKEVKQKHYDANPKKYQHLEKDIYDNSSSKILGADESNRFEKMSSLEKEARMVDIARLSDFIGIPGIGKSIQKIMQKTRGSAGVSDLAMYMQGVKNHRGNRAAFVQALKVPNFKRVPLDSMGDYLSDLSNRSSVTSRNVSNLMESPKINRRAILDNILTSYK